MAATAPAVSPKPKVGVSTRVLACLVFFHAAAWNGSGLCRRENIPAAAPSSNRSCGEQESFAHGGVYPLLLCAQLLLGVASVPMQPFGISYIDDHASRKNSPLYLGLPPPPPPSPIGSRFLRRRDRS